MLPTPYKSDCLPDGFTFHHLGLACDGPEPTFGVLTSLGYQVGPTVTDPLQQVELSMCSRSGMPRIEVIWPSNLKGPLQRVLEVAKCGVYHMCFRTPDRTAALRYLSSRGHRVMQVIEPRPAVLFGGASVSFHFISGLGLTEILESERELL